MKTLKTWKPFEGDIAEIQQQFPLPLIALAQGEVPALVLRGAYKPKHCSSLIDRFYERGLVNNPHGTGRPHRVDIGTSFGKHQADWAKFFAHSC